MKINFITSNKGKVTTVNDSLKMNGINAEVIATDLNIIEPQADSVAEVSMIKAKAAYDILKQPVLVEDGGFEVEALKGFPGVYTKFMLTTIGVDGLLDLLKNKENRNAKFVSCTTYINEKGQAFQFHRKGGEGLIKKEKVNVKCDYAWSDIWYVFYDKGLGKTFAESTQEEMLEYYSQPSQKSSLVLFAEWMSNKKG